MRATLIIFILMCCVAARGSILLITLDQDGTNNVTLLGKQNVTPQELNSKMERLAAYSTNLTVHVRATRSASATQLMRVVTDLREIGLYRLVIWWEGEQRGTPGWILVPCQTSTTPVPLCFGDEPTSFIPTLDTDPPMSGQEEKAVEHPAAHVFPKAASGL